MEKINRGITQSQGAYSDAMKKLSEGRGNLVAQTEKLRKLGAKVGKTISEKLISQSDPFEAEISNE
jgi:DNA recombination protein RmuC